MHAAPLIRSTSWDRLAELEERPMLSDTTATLCHMSGSLKPDVYASFQSHQKHDDLVRFSLQQHLRCHRTLWIILSRLQRQRGWHLIDVTDLPTWRMFVRYSCRCTEHAACNSRLSEFLVFSSCHHVKWLDVFVCSFNLWETMFGFPRSLA